jgi:hypothetical protein
MRQRCRSIPLEFSKHAARSGVLADAGLELALAILGDGSG